MLAQEIASIIHTVLDAAGNPIPYYNNIPKDFHVSSVYFPVPEEDSSGSSLSSYKISYLWFVKFFASETAIAYEMASKVLEYIVSHRNLIPLYNEDGTLTGKSMRIDYPKLRKIEDSIVQLQIDWSCIRSYYQETAVKMTNYTAARNETIIQQYDINLAFQTAIETYLFDYPQASTQKYAGESQI